MFGSAILDVAIGMAFLYLLLSLIASALQEVMALVVQSRSANLLRGIRSMLSGGTLPSGQTLLQALYNHGLVRSLYQVPGVDYVENRVRAKTRVFFGWVRLLLRWTFGMRVPGGRWDVNELLLPAYIPSRVFAVAMRDILVRNPGFLTAAPAVVPEGAATNQVVLVDSKAAANLAIEALRALVKDARGDSAKLQENLENWYNDTMDRVSGWYKRYTQSVLLVIGLLLAIVFNVSSIKIVRALWVDKDARAALASEADAYMKKHEGAGPAPVTTPGGFSSFGDDLKGTVEAYHGAVDTLLPVGWKHSPGVYWTRLSVEKGQAAERYLLVLLGWIVTAIALSYGAPFWFDTLNKFMGVRSTVKPREKSQTEPSKS